MSPPPPTSPGALPPGHPSVSSGKAPPSAAELLKQLDATPDLKTKEKTFDVAAALGKLYYGNGRYPDAVVYFQQALEKVKPLRALFTAQQQKAGHAQAARGKGDFAAGLVKAQRNEEMLAKKASAVGCTLTSDAQLDALTAKANQLATSHDASGAEACAHEALKPVVDTQVLYANALFLTGDAKGALAQYEDLLAVSPALEEGLYGYAGTLLDSDAGELASLQRARAVLTLELKWAPQGPHAGSAKRLLQYVTDVVAAGGQTAYLAQHHASPPPPGPVASAGKDAAPPAISPAVMDAVKNTEMTPEMVEGLKKLVDTAEDHLAHARFQDALDAYKRVVPFTPNDGRARAGMAWSLVGLNRQPMADRIWQVAVSSDAAAVDKLGDALAQKGDHQGAVALWKKLLASNPGYGASSGLAKKIP